MKNIGYKLGKLVLRYKKWQHPSLLKWLYVLVFASVCVITYQAIICLIIASVVANLLVNSIRTPQNNKEMNEMNELPFDTETGLDNKEGYGYGNEGFGYYVGNHHIGYYRVDDDEEETSDSSAY